MWPNNFFFAKTTSDITDALKKLVAAGCTEKEIANFARLRACYARTTDHLLDYYSSSILKGGEEVNLAFYRWLFQTGRLQP